MTAVSNEASALTASEGMKRSMWFALDLGDCQGLAITPIGIKENGLLIKPSCSDAILAASCDSISVSRDDLNTLNRILHESVFRYS